MSDDTPLKWDEEFAANLLGARVLIGLTYLRKNGDFHSQVQMHGEITSVDPSGVTIALAGVHEGETYVLPPDLTSFVVANPGVYTLRSTGEVIEDPDYTTSWAITKPD
jgi:hypothetical protein